MYFFKIFSMTLLLISISFFGFCAFTLKPTVSPGPAGVLTTQQLNFAPGHSDAPKVDTLFRNTNKVSKVGKYYDVMEMDPMYFNVRLEKIRDLSMQPRCVDR